MFCDRKVERDTADGDRFEMGKMNVTDEGKFKLSAVLHMFKQMLEHVRNAHTPMVTVACRLRYRGRIGVVRRLKKRNHTQGEL